MVYYIIIRGPAGIGKTTISRELANEIDAEIVHFDRIMDELGLDYVSGDKWIPLIKFLKADRIMIPRFRERLKAGNIVIDGNFYHKKQIEDLVGKLRANHFVFTLKADLEECIRRDRSREGSLGKQAVSDIYRLTTAFDYGTTIDTSGRPIKEVVRKIRGYLPR